MGAHQRDEVMLVFRSKSIESFYECFDNVLVIILILWVSMKIEVVEHLILK